MDEHIPIRPGGAWAFQDRDQPAAVVIDILDHPEELGGVWLHFAGVLPFVILWTDERRMRCVGGNVGEERRLLLAFAVDPAQGLVEEDIGAIALGLFELAIVEN